MSSIDISLVVTVFNKERYLPATVQSLLRQRETSGLAIEYVFVDDVSSDRSIECIESLTTGLDDVVIIRNGSNAGPSVRLNQGVRVANGRYVQFLDSDDILAANATAVMHDLLEKYQADMIHGSWERTQLAGGELLEKFIPEKPDFTVSDTPLEFVLDGRFLRMAQLCLRDLYLKANGADERIFIQDESLPLRLAVQAKRVIKLHEPVIYIPKVEGQLSGNVAQLNHDRFLANYYMLQDNIHLSHEVREKLLRRCISAHWKQVRRKGIPAYGGGAFIAYLKSRVGAVKNPQIILANTKAYFDALPNVRRMPKGDAIAA